MNEGRKGGREGGNEGREERQFINLSILYSTNQMFLLYLAFDFLFLFS